MSKIVVVGANHAGTACIKTMLSQKTGDEIVVFDSNSNISFLGCGMALWIGGQIKGSDGLFYSNKEELEQMGAKIYMESPVERIDFDNKIVYAKLKDGSTKEESYDKLVLATGSWPIIPNVEGKDLENVQMVKLFQHAEEVIEKLKDETIKNVAVVGAGYIGVELAEAFERHGKNVTIVDIADTCLPAYYDPEFNSLMKQNLADHGINLAFGQMMKKLEGENGKVTKLITDKASYDVDMVIMCIGFRPNTELGKDKLETFRNGAYIVNRNQETSIKDVYAIGDCATVFDNSIDDVNYIALATNAVRSGIVGGHNAVGVKLDSIGVQGSNGICIYDLKMVSTGLTYNKALKLGINAEYTDFEDFQKSEFIEEENPKVKIRIVYDKDTRVIIGAQMASTHDMSMGIHMFSLAIQEKVTIEKLSLTDIFFLPHFNKPYNYITMAAISAK